MISENEYLGLMRRGWHGGLRDGTPCGAGSTLQNTQGVREWLPDLVRRWRFSSICDAGAGDLHWISQLAPLPGYEAFDLVPRKPQVRALDIRSEALPTCDLILCRLVLGHMTEHWVQQTLALFRKSGRYLLATTHEGAQPQKIHTFNRWNLAAPPFDLGEPLESIADVDGYQLALWRLQ